MNYLFLHEHAHDWEAGEFRQTGQGNSPTPGLRFNPGASSGHYVSAIMRAPFAATEAILSINSTSATPAESGLIARVSSSRDATHWSPWFTLVSWGTIDQTTEETKESDDKVAVDILRLSRPARYWRYKVAWQGQEDFKIRRAALSLHDPGVRDPVPAEPRREAWGRRLDVPHLSQWDISDHPTERICSPVAVAMVGRFYGLECPATEIVAAVYDEPNDIYGNWPLNMLAASHLGLKAYVDRGSSLRFLEDHLAAGRPIICSVAFRAGELASAPIPETSGHLLVVAGFDDSGAPEIRDPAARPEGTWLTYDRDQFARAWLGHGGVAYVCEPEAA